MPKLSPVQLVILVVFLVFYGFAVFAVTRDYYLRNPPRIAVAAPATKAPHSLPGSGAPTWIQRQMQNGGDGSLDLPAGTNPVLLNEQGDALFAQKRYREAIGHYRRVLELDADDVDAYNDLGLALHYTGESEQALEILKLGTQKSPELQRIWLTLGFVSANAGDPEGAQAALERARSLDPESDVGKEAARLLGLLVKRP